MLPSRAAVLVLALAAAAAASSCASDGADETFGLQTYIQNAQSYAEGGHYDQSLSQFRKALEIEPTNSKALLGEATCLYWLGTEETPAGGRYVLEAEEKFAALNAGDYGENAWKVHLLRGMVNSRLSDLWGRKAEQARKAAAEGGAAAAADLKEAESQRDAHDRTSAEEFKAVLAAEDQPLARNNLAALFALAYRSAQRAVDAGGYDEALGYFGRYMKEVEKSRNLWIEMKKREPKAADLYEAKLQSAQRQEIELRDLIADIHFKRRDHEASIAELDRILALDPYKAEAFFNRGRNQEELGRFGAAADDYHRFLKVTDLPPGSAQVIEASDRMARCEDRVREKMEK